MISIQLCARCGGQRVVHHRVPIAYCDICRPIVLLASNRAKVTKFNHTPGFKASLRRYRQSDKGKLAVARSRARRSAATRAAWVTPDERKQEHLEFARGAYAMLDEAVAGHRGGIEELCEDFTLEEEEAMRVFWEGPHE